MYINFQKGGRGQQRASKWGSWSAAGGFEHMTLNSKCRDLIRSATTGDKRQMETDYGASEQR